MAASTLDPHLTWRFSDPASYTARHPNQETYGWSCQSPRCPAGRSRYHDPRDAAQDADTHERQEALTLFEPGTLVVFVGPAAAGKSRFSDTFPADWVVSLDELRGRLTGDRGKQSVTPQAVRIQDLLVETRLEHNVTTILDSTNVEAAVRAQLVARARRWGRPVVAVVFVTGLDVCLLRNAKRPANRRVPDDTVTWQFEQTELSLPALAGERFTSVRTIDAG
ncbi:ATP-binding protein [Streptomyces sp. NBC_01601]|uniref:ATP-binding protein n=1 Tax=Streptomyces sp. NBC_01601 TaxID=2975892 RepID=UPI002E2A66C9|nr:ATP-binding protein [Streptomyces sp. NBC_01601]